MRDIQSCIKCSMEGRRSVTLLLLNRHTHRENLSPSCLCKTAARFVPYLCIYDAQGANTEVCVCYVWRSDCPHCTSVILTCHPPPPLHLLLLLILSPRLSFTNPPFEVSESDVIFLSSGASLNTHTHTHTHTRTHTHTHTHSGSLTKPVKNMPGSHFTP